MFKQAFGSPRLTPKEDEQEVSILSPRNFLKLIANSIGEFRRIAPNQNNYEEFVSTFTPYLQTFQEQYKKYTQSKTKKSNRDSRNQQLQMQLKLNRIPNSYFIGGDTFSLELCKRSEIKKKQEELTQYLDEIELALFTKVGKYPEKSNIILQNMDSLGLQADHSLSSVLEFRRQLKSKLMVISQKQLKIKRIKEKRALICKAIEYSELLKKMKNLRDCSSNDLDSTFSQQMLLKIKKSDLQHCSKFNCLQKIVKNIQNYRGTMKNKLYKQFLAEIQHIFCTLLKYNKEEWKNINVPESIFQGQGKNSNPNISHNNITILDQSYFDFEMNQVNIISHKSPSLQPIINEENEDENNDVLDLTKICKLWGLIKQFDLYDMEQVNQNFTKILVRHNAAFNHDMEDYMTYLYNNITKEEKQTNQILKGPQTYASLKVKLAQKQQSKPVQIDSSPNIQLSQQKMSAVDMKLFLKIVKFQYNLFKKVLSFINDYKQFQFIVNFKTKLAEILEGIIQFFANAKKITHELTVDDFLVYLEIIYFWEHEEFYEIIEYCENLKNLKIDQYLTNVQKNLLIKELKIDIEQSTYLPINVSSNHYMTFHYLLSPEGAIHCIDDDMNMSMTMPLEQPVENYLNNAKESVTLRLINKNIIYKQKAYKICDSFLKLIQNLERFKKLKEHLPEFSANIQEKMCELIGFYAWYNQKNLINSKAGAKTLKNYCTFYSSLLLLKEILQSLALTNKKIEKTKVQLNDCESQISKTISMTPFMTVEYQISQMYESKVTAKSAIPTSQSQRIIEILKISFDCLKDYFPIEYEQKLHQSLIVKFMQTTIKLIYKNYFGYLSNMEKRGIAELKWFLPRLREVTEATILGNSNIINKAGQLLSKKGSIFCLFNEQLDEMERILKQKQLRK